MATTLRNVTHALEQVKNVVSGTGDQHWEGQTAEAFRGLMAEDLKPRIEAAWSSLTPPRGRVDRWVVDLGSFQSRADALEIEAEQARQEMASAQTALAGMGDKPTTRTRRRRSPSSRTPGSARCREAALDDVIARAHTLGDEATTSATTTAGALQTAMDAAPDEPGLWDWIAGAIEDIGAFLGDVIESLREGELVEPAPPARAHLRQRARDRLALLPGAGAVRLGLAIADTLMSGIDWARGVPGAQGFLTGAVGLVGGFAVGKAAGSFTEVAGPSLATGPFRVIASGAGGGSIAAPAAAVLSFNPSFGPALAGFMFIQAKDAKDASDTVTTLLGGNTYYSDSLASGWRKARED